MSWLVQRSKPFHVKSSSCSLGKVCLVTTTSHSGEIKKPILVYRKIIMENHKSWPLALGRLTPPPPPPKKKKKDGYSRTKIPFSLFMGKGRDPNHLNLCFFAGSSARICNFLGENGNFRSISRQHDVRAKTRHIHYTK